jgi:hypothetical protein
MRVRCGGAPAPVLAALLLGACGSEGAAPPSPSVVIGTPTVSATALQVTLHGAPVRTFGSGHWRVCDSGTVTNPSTVLARDVRVVVVYYDHGVVDGQTTRAQATSDGGALGDIAAGQSHDFTVCGTSRNEPDRDVVSAAPTS